MVLKIEEAFLRAISKRGIYRELNVSAATVSNWKRSLAGKGDLSKNPPPSIKIMRKVLEKLGHSVITENTWWI
jgi:DNA invertase Pin-like site-specific DNA recombinase